LLMCAWKVFPCLAAGNCAVLKCSEETPLTMLKLCHLMRECGFPKGVINVVPGYGPTAGERLTRHMKVSKISFTGSNLVGSMIMKASSESNLKKVQLELGGKSTLVVFADCNLEEAVTSAVESYFRNTSRNCCTSSRLMIQDTIYDKFMTRFIEATKSMKTSSQDMDTCTGPLMNKTQFTKVMGFIKRGKEEKLKLEIGGDRMFEKGYFVQPTVFSGVPETSELMEEVFGPVVFVMKPFKDCMEVMERVNRTKCSFSSGVFTKCPDTAEAFVRTVRTGTVWVNSYNMTNWNVPCGGMKMCGTGCVYGAEAMKEYTTTKSCYKKFDLSKFCPMNK